MQHWQPAPCQQAEGWEKSVPLFSQPKPIENDTGKEVQYTKTNVRITFHSVWAINRASPCPFWHCCTWHLLFPHLLISSTFLCLIPSYTVVQPLTFYCISFFPFSFFFYPLSFFELPFPLKLANDNKRITNCKKSSGAFICTSCDIKTGCHFSAVLEPADVLTNRQYICCLRLIWL